MDEVVDEVGSHTQITLRWCALQEMWGIKEMQKPDKPNTLPTNKKPAPLHFT
jgi:hypothetical protein